MKESNNLMTYGTNKRDKITGHRNGEIHEDRGKGKESMNEEFHYYRRIKHTKFTKCFEVDVQ